MPTAVPAQAQSSWLPFTQTDTGHNASGRMPPPPVPPIPPWAPNMVSVVVSDYEPEVAVDACDGTKGTVSWRDRR